MNDEKKIVVGSQPMAYVIAATITVVVVFPWVVEIWVIGAKIFSPS